jgi:hypothetical protein
MAIMQEAAKRRGVMLPRLSYHDYRRVCGERSEAIVHGILFAEDEPGVGMAGLKVRAAIYCPQISIVAPPLLWLTEENSMRIAITGTILQFACVCYRSTEYS